MNEAKSILRIALVQQNPTLGAIAANCDLAMKAIREAASGQADLVLFSELFVSGYPPEDLVLKPAFVSDCMAAVEKLAADIAGELGENAPGVLIGSPYCDATGRYNGVALLDHGRVETWRMKVDLPNYAVFDEKRVFDAGPMPGPVNFRGIRIGVPICEDIWGDLGICETLAEAGAQILLVPNGSPFTREKMDIRHQVAVRQVVESGLPLAWLNQLGGQDELVFDGGSFVINADHHLAVQMNQFEESVLITTWHRHEHGWACEDGPRARLPGRDESEWRACVLGLRDYVNKNGFGSVILGLSGGIDSAVCAAMAVDALGEERVRSVMLPFHYTSDHSLKDAQDCANALGIAHESVSIVEPVEGFTKALQPLFEGTATGITEENLQSRARGVILMAISNKFGSMVVTTGNKSEMSVGYATLYGDMNGGYNPIKDLYKMRVYALAKWRNANMPPDCLGPAGEVIPQNIIDKVPSAELRPNQSDQDSLPPYPQLDDILECLVENEMSVGEIVARGHERQLVERIENLLYIAEYKRRQSAPGVKISARNFGRDRRYPITNRFRDR